MLSRTEPGGREWINGHRAPVLWFTGLSGAGKTTLTQALHAALLAQGRQAVVLDGDLVRRGLCADLGFSPDDRRENLRRVAEVARLFAEAGQIVLAAFISPMREDRDMIRNIVGPTRFLEIFVDCPLATCEGRDVKGLYRRARAGEIPDFTGVSAPYEAPLAPACRIDTALADPDAALATLLDWVLPRIALNAPTAA